MWSRHDELRFRPRRRPTLELGMTPLIDIVFLLLIFFMLTSHFVVQEGIQVDLPVTQRSHTLSGKTPHRIVIRSDDSLVMDGMPMTLEEMRTSLAGRDSRFITSPFEILADKDASVQTVVSLLEMLRNSGASRVSLGTEKERDKRP